MHLFEHVEGAAGLQGKEFLNVDRLDVGHVHHAQHGDEMVSDGVFVGEAVGILRDARLHIGGQPFPRPVDKENVIVDAFGRGLQRYGALNQVVRGWLPCILF